MQGSLTPQRQPRQRELAWLSTGDVQDGRALLLARTLSGAERGDLRFNDPALDLAARRVAAGGLLTALE